MVNARMALTAAIRQAALITCAAAGMATFAGAQTTFKLKVSAVGIADGTFYRGTAQVTSDPTGIDCRAELLGDVGPTGACTASFPAGTLVTLTATPLFDGTFDGWTGACAGQGLTCHVEMTMDSEVAARTIAKTYTLTVRGGGNAFGQVHSNDFFGRPRIACNVQGEDTFGVCVSEYPAGQQVWLGREEPTNTFARFAGWSGCGPLSDESNCRMVMDGPKIVTAGWIAAAIIIGSNHGSGTGNVTGAAPLGSAPFDCTITPTGATGVCSALWEFGPTSITLTARPTGNSVFLGWLGSTCSGTGTCVLTPFGQFRQPEIRAWFEMPLHRFSVEATGSGNGKVLSNPTRIDCVITGGTAGPDCSTLFSRGTAVTLTADPTGGGTFGGWAGACSGTQPTCALVIDADAHATARFNPPRPAGEVALALLGHLTLSPDEAYQLDRFGNADGTFNLGDLLALIDRTGGRLSPSTMSALMQSRASGAVRRGDGRSQ